MTIPTLVNNYQKKIVESRLKLFYSTMSQAVMLSEIDNGPHTEWDYGGSAQGVYDNVKKYILPYVRYTTYKKPTYLDYASNVHAEIVFPNGSTAQFGNGWYLWDIHYFANGTDRKHYRPAREIFTFFISATTPFSTYVYSLPKDITRDELLDKCNGSARWYCSTLIMHDGWKIKDDYKW